jgi:hypothetical protein
MKLKSIILSILSISTLFAMGQETPKPAKTKEYYLAVVDISPINFSIKYKRQIKNRTFFKIGLVDLSASDQTVSSSLSSTYSTGTSLYSAGLECGIEFRKPISDKLSFFHGPSLSYKYRIDISKTDNPALPPDQRRFESQTMTPGVVYSLGLLFRFNDHFLMSAEINPYVSYSFRTFNSGPYPQYNTKSNTANFGFSNRYGLLSIAYRI